MARRAQVGQPINRDYILHESIDEITKLSLITVDTIVRGRVFLTTRHAIVGGTLEEITDAHFLAHDIPVEWRKIFNLGMLWTTEDMRFAQAVMTRFEPDEQSCVKESLLKDIDQEYASSNRFTDLINANLFHLYHEGGDESFDVISGLAPRVVRPRIEQAVEID